MTSATDSQQAALTAIVREYPESEWSCSVWDDDPSDITVAFQRYSDDAEARYSIRNGEATPI